MKTINRPPTGILRVTANRPVPATVSFQSALNYRHVLPVNLPISDQAIQDRNDDWVLGHDHGSTGLEVKPVHHVGPVIASRQITGHIVNHRPGFPSYVGMTLLPPRLVDHQ